MKHCERCGKPEPSGSMSVAEFKSLFKVGEIIVGWSTQKQCRITAIGDERILYRDLRLDHFRSGSIERVAKIRQNFQWQKYDRILHGLLPDEAKP